MGSKNFIWIQNLPIYIYKFFLDFWNFKNIFQGFKMILAFSRIVFEPKMIFINSEIKKIRKVSKPYTYIYIYAGVALDARSTTLFLSRRS